MTSALTAAPAATWTSWECGPDADANLPGIRDLVIVVLVTAVVGALEWVIDTRAHEQTRRQAEAPAAEGHAHSERVEDLAAGVCASGDPQR
ncbi:hypothetical protein SAMN04490220_0382 [Rhodococcus jostii]|uniref:Uncharacterized protein n=1 Tax=Rhodococcus jostii TaxID=132919 RepID=A0A1H4IQA8_RHOJO|nr:hypothetical protein SAMN04490220_0382 [Rhodococcus jostii]